MAGTQTEHAWRKVAFLAAVIVNILILTGLVTHWLGVPTAWSVFVAGSLAIVGGAITIGGDTLKSSRMTYAPFIAAVSVFVVLTLISVLTIAFGSKTVTGRPTANQTEANTTAAAPFVVGVDAFAGGTCGTYAFEQSAAALAPIPNIGTADLAGWLSEHNAIQALPYGRFTGAKLIINITGATDSPVTIKRISFSALATKPQVIERIVISGQCGDATVGRFIEVNVDESPPKILATNSDPNGIWGGEPVDLTPIRFPYTVKNGDSEPFYVIAESHQYVEYNARIDWMYEGKSGSTIVDDHGKPFRIAAPGADAPQTQGWG